MASTKSGTSLAVTHARDRLIAVLGHVAADQESYPRAIPQNTHIGVNI